MRQFLFGLVAAAGLIAASAVNPPTEARAQQVMPATAKPLTLPETGAEPQRVVLPLGKTHLVDLPLPARDVIIANPDVADVIVKTPTRTYIVANAIGETNVFFIGTDGDVILHMTVAVEIDLSGAQKAIEALLPDAKIELRGINGSVGISGVVRTARESADVADIVNRYLGTEDAIINMLKILGDQQVMLKVRIAEIDRTVTKDFGISATVSEGIGDTAFTIVGTAAAAVTNPVATGSIAINAFGIGDAAYRALETEGLTKTLAEPVLTAISGETANFLAGGSVPVQAGVDDSGVAVFELHEIGVALSFTPVVLANNQISLRIATSTESISAANTVTNTVSGEIFTGFTTRRAETTVTLPSGGSIMIAGIIQDENSLTSSGTPWLKDIPILGALFRSHNFQNDETELVVMVTPYIVKPVETANQLALPTDGFIPASDADMYLFGRLHGQYGKGAALPTTVVGPIGYIME